MSAFKTLGPIIHVTDDGYAVAAVLNLDLDNLDASTIVTHLVLGPDGLPVFADPDAEKAIAVADEYEQSVEPGLP